ncbi:hypothetical protein SAMN05428953_11744 [Mesorhizobium muleiense]|uniref:Uncharacterized protein n=1 Tax=Mesorhizobium muleiense TaxID=1004279 RepID=A0A1G9D2T1_9HYPH|nr:hypothetical protein SAMN05428953_11744 [Mesorhizobium muleiense]
MFTALISLSFSWARIGNLPVLYCPVPRLAMKPQILGYLSVGDTYRHPMGPSRLPLLIEKNTTRWQKLIEIVEVAHIACENNPAAFQRLEI